MKRNIEKNFHRLDKTKISIISLKDESKDTLYWRSQTPEKRIHHIEFLRILNYGAQASSRLQRFFEVAELK